MACTESKSILLWRTVLNAVLGIRIRILSQIRIRMFLGLPDSDSFVRGMEPVWILPFSQKGVERTETMLAK